MDCGRGASGAPADVCFRICFLTVCSQDKQLLQAVAKYAQVDWNLVRTELSGLQPPTSAKTPQSLEKRWNVLKNDLTSLGVGKQRLSG
ncbi:hypothetical protein M407DRAFT_246397 [Tulasnella calospora MUT 4182]|uniref:Uncharacterized protein n=1 Tax=Tulasnella calospora MUT 4182 TaxID=1051891 RepID=A0A0C3LB48_9AGAM|nr:hypothetical protein M407DRAFT_246397 [Tulasnella calospora MUT 4182]